MTTNSQGANEPHHVAPLGLINRNSRTSSNRAPSAQVPSPPLDHIGGNVKGEQGFSGIDALVNSSKNSPYLGGVGDVTPPDQALAVGPSRFGTAEVEIVNDTLGIYSPNGQSLISALPSFQVFDQPPLSFMSDPRAYWDAASGHWFLTMFAVPALGGPPTVGQYGCTNGGAVENGCQAAQFVAVSATKDPLGSYKVFWIKTSGGVTSGSGGHIGDDCPCFGDYDMLGADQSGLYITTNQFCFNGRPVCAHSATGGFNGTVIYAISKSKLIAAAAGAPAPAVVAYGVDTLSDPFAAYHLSPSTVTQGSTAPNTEYFVESNANLPADPALDTSGLEVFALLHTSALDSGGTPPLVNTAVGSEKYTATPPNAVQKSGPIPYGNKVGQGTTAALSTDFNAVQEVTYSSGLLYGELSTGVMLGQQENSGVAWFVLRPTTTSSTVAVTNRANGYVATTQELLYPVVSVNAAGHGYIAFAIAGPDMYPSAAYVTFDGTSGPGNVVHVAAKGTDPLDDFSCYPGGACRYGDYSMAQQFDGNTYMATEYVPGGKRDTYANWGTRLYMAPTP